MKWLIYKATAPSGRCYVGLTNNFYDRKREHKSAAFKKNFSKYPFYAAIRKYGWEQITWEFLEENLPTLEDAIKAEMEWITTTKSHLKGYNQTPGGIGGALITTVMKNKISTTLKDVYHADPTVRQKHSRERGGGSVYAFRADGRFVAQFTTAADCSEILEVSRGHICSILSGKRNITKGYTFSKTPEFPILKWIKPERRVSAFQNGSLVGTWDNCCDCARALKLSRNQVTWSLKGKLKSKPYHPYEFKYES